MDVNFAYWPLLQLLLSQNAYLKDCVVKVVVSFSLFSSLQLKLFDIELRRAKHVYNKKLYFLSSVYTITYWLSVRLPYGDILHSLTYAGIRWSSLAHRFGFVFSSSQYVGIRWHTLLFAQYVEDFCACTNFFDVCRRMDNTQRVRPSNATRTLCSFTIR